MKFLKFDSMATILIMDWAAGWDTVNSTRGLSGAGVSGDCDYGG